MTSSNRTRPTQSPMSPLPAQAVRSAQVAAVAVIEPTTTASEERRVEDTSSRCHASRPDAAELVQVTTPAARDALEAGCVIESPQPGDSSAGRGWHRHEGANGARDDTHRRQHDTASGRRPGGLRDHRGPGAGDDL